MTWVYTAWRLTRYVAMGRQEREHSRQRRVYAVAWSVGRSVCPRPAYLGHREVVKEHQTLLETNAGPGPVAGLQPHATSWFSFWKVIRGGRLDAQHRGQNCTPSTGVKCAVTEEWPVIQAGTAGLLAGHPGWQRQPCLLSHEGVRVAGLLAHFSIPVCYVSHNHLEENIRVF